MSSKPALVLPINREPFAQIVAGEKRVEYRDLSAYYAARFDKLKPPFLLLLRNGYGRQYPEALVEIGAVVKNRGRKRYELKISKIAHVKRWPKRK